MGAFAGVGLRGVSRYAQAAGGEIDVGAVEAAELADAQSGQQQRLDHGSARDVVAVSGAGGPVPEFA
jgi:glycerol-3-phosphate dehydrogenase